MTHNEAGQRMRPWVSVARSPQGEFGVAFGVGERQLGFIPEANLTEFIAVGLKEADENAFLALVIEEAAALPKFKSHVAWKKR